MSELSTVTDVASILEISEAIRVKRVSPVELAQESLRRAQEIGSRFNAFITLCEERAILLARAAEQRAVVGARLGVLDGVPITVKDLIDVAGISTSNGAGQGWHSAGDCSAPTVAHLERAGAVIIGKTNLHELAMGITSDNPHYGPVRNPWDPQRSPGGSSGGSAVAVALGIGYGSVGTDTGGSVRIPAAHCGIFGLKPTYGMISTKGVSPISWSLDHVGPMAARVEDLACLLAEMLGRSRSDRTAIEGRDVRGLRIGVPTAYFNQRLEAAIAEAYASVLRELKNAGAVLIDTVLPAMDDIVAAAFMFSKAEAGHLHRDRYATHAAQLGPDVRGFLGAGRGLSALDYVAAVERQRAFRAEIDNLFTNVDVLLVPTTPAAPKRFDQAEVVIDGTPEPMFDCMIRYTSIFNVSGHPVVSAPAGLSSDGLPIGIQIVGPYQSEDRLLQVALAYQQLTLSTHFERLATLRREVEVTARGKE